MRYEDFFYLIGRTNFPKIGIVARISVYDLFSNKDVPLYYQAVNTTHYRLDSKQEMFKKFDNGTTNNAFITYDNDANFSISLITDKSRFPSNLSDKDI